LIEHAVDLIAITNYLYPSRACCSLAVALGETALAHYHVDDLIPTDIKARSVCDGLLQVFQNVLEQNWLVCGILTVSPLFRQLLLNLTVLVLVEERLYLLILLCLRDFRRNLFV